MLRRGASADIGPARTSAVFFAHRADEAFFLADRIIVMSPRPGRILEEIPVPFKRPRATDIVASQEFGRLKHHCLELLRVRSYGVPLTRLSPLGFDTGDGG
jgi:NitT/TauT family transport system ATP-binding protein